MILNDTKQNPGVIQSEGVQESNSFKVVESAHLFQILSNGLYADKEGSVIREVACNGNDAHVMAGKKELPIEVKLPTIADRTFYIKDWGPGLDHDEVVGLYTVVGMSSKQQSNDVTGAFGLGSKSPFAYTSSNEEESSGFTVTAVKNGVKRTYACYKNDQGEPKVDLLFEGFCDEPTWQNGVKVSFPVQRADIDLFHKKAHEMLQWFEVLPKTLHLNGELKKPSFTYQGSFFGIGLESEHSYHYNRYGNNARVVMGNVAYPIEKTKLKGLSDVQVRLLDAGITLFAPIGSVLMQPSREGLQYTSKTETYIKKALDEAAIEIALNLKAVFVDTDLSPWSWRKALFAEYTKLNKLGLKSCISELLELSGVDSEIIKSKASLISREHISSPVWVGEGSDPVNKKVSKNRVWCYFKNQNGEAVRSEVVQGRYGSASNNSAFSLSLSEEVLIAYADTNHANERAKYLVNQGTYNRVLVVGHGKLGNNEGSSFAKAYAEKIAKEADDWEGIDVKSLAAITTAFQVPVVEKAPKVEMTAAEKIAATSVSFWSPGCGHYVRQTTFGDITSESEKFYLVTGNSASDRINRMCLRDNDNSAVKLDNSYQSSTILESMFKLMNNWGMPASKVLLLRSDGSVRRLKLAEQGYKPLMATFKAWVSTEEIAAKATALRYTVEHNANNRQSLKSTSNAQQYLWMGLLAFHKLNNTPQWNSHIHKLVPEGSKVEKMMAELISNVDDSQPPPEVSEEAKKENELLAACKQINGLHQFENLAEQINPTYENYYELRSRFVRQIADASLLASAFKVEFLFTNASNKGLIKLLKHALEDSNLFKSAEPDKSKETQE